MSGYAPQSARNHGQFAVGLGQRDARLEASRHIADAAARAKWLRKRNPQVGARLRRHALEERSRAVRKLKGCGHDADDRERLIVQHERSSENRLPTAKSLPEALADDSDQAAIVWTERAPEERRYAEHRKKSARLGRP